MDLAEVGVNLSMDSLEHLGHGKLLVQMARWHNIRQLM